MRLKDNIIVQDVSSNVMFSSAGMGIVEVGDKLTPGPHLMSGHVFTPLSAMSAQRRKVSHLRHRERSRLFKGICPCNSCLVAPLAYFAG